MAKQLKKLPFQLHVDIDCGGEPITEDKGALHEGTEGLQWRVQ